MPAMYRGEPVTVLRPAFPEDMHLTEPGTGHLLVRLRDTTKKIVPEAEVKDEEEAVAATASEPVKAVMEPKKHKRKIIAKAAGKKRKKR